MCSEIEYAMATGKIKGLRSVSKVTGEAIAKVSVLSKGPADDRDNVYLGIEETQ